MTPAQVERLLPERDKQIVREFWALSKNKTFLQHLQDYLLTALTSTEIELELQNFPDEEAARILFHAALSSYIRPVEGELYAKINRAIAKTRLF